MAVSVCCLRDYSTPKGERTQSVNMARRGKRQSVCSSAFAIGEIPDAMSESLAAPLESRSRTESGPRGKPAVLAQRGKLALGIANLEHLFGVVLPVGGKTQDAVRAQSLRQPVREARLDSPAPGMPLLGPGSRDAD